VRLSWGWFHSKALNPLYLPCKYYPILWSRFRGIPVNTRRFQVLQKIISKADLGVFGHAEQRGEVSFPISDLPAKLFGVKDRKKYVPLMPFCFYGKNFKYRCHKKSLTSVASYSNQKFGFSGRDS